MDLTFNQIFILVDRISVRVRNDLCDRVNIAGAEMDRAEAYEPGATELMDDKQRDIAETSQLEFLAEKRRRRKGQQNLKDEQVGS